MTLYPTHSMRWLQRGKAVTLQQLFYDETGRHHWIDVPVVDAPPE